MNNNSFLILEIGEKFLKIAEGGIKKDKFFLQHFDLLEAPFNIYEQATFVDIEKYSQFIEEALKKNSLKTKNTHLIIPDSRSYSQIFQMPILTEKELISAVRYQIEQFIPLPVEKVSLDIEIIHEDKKNNQLKLLLVASENSYLDILVKVCEASGLIPQIIENETSCLLRFLTNHYLENSLFVNFGYSNISFYGFDDKKHLPLAIHNLSFGVDVFVKEIAANLMIDEKKSQEYLFKKGIKDDIFQIVLPSLNEIISNLQRFIVSFEEKYSQKINQISLFNQAVSINGLKDEISKKVNLPVKTLVFDSILDNETLKNQKVSENLPLVYSIFGALI